MEKVIYVLIAILIFGALVALHELGHFTTAKLCGVRVNEFSIGMGPALWSHTWGETQYSLRALPLGGYCAMEGEEENSDDPRSLERKGFWQKVLIFSAGSLMNFITGFVILVVLYSAFQSFPTTEIVGFAPEFAAQGEDGLQPGDRLWTINGERVYQYGDVQLLTSLDQDDNVELEVRRNGEIVPLGTVPLPYQTYSNVNGGSYEGFGLTIRVEPPTLGATLRYSWMGTVDFVRTVRLSLKMLINGQAGLKDLSGPVGIVNTITEEGAKAQAAGGFGAALRQIFFFAALLAVNLAVMNLLPIPALDGGRIFFLAVDAVALLLFHKKVPEKYQIAVNTAGLAVLMGVMLLVTFHDVFKLFQ